MFGLVWFMICFISIPVECVLIHPSISSFVRSFVYLCSNEFINFVKAKEEKMRTQTKHIFNCSVCERAVPKCSSFLPISPFNSLKCIPYQTFSNPMIAVVLRFLFFGWTFFCYCRSSPTHTLSFAFRISHRPLDHPVHFSSFSIAPHRITDALAHSTYPMLIYQNI